MSEAAIDIPRKRQRVTQACHRCRSKKYKCNSVRPACSTCIASNSECSYGTAVKRRGLQSGYVRAIEILWGLVFKRIAGSQDGVNKLLAELSIVINQTPADSNENDNADDLLKYWRSSGVPSAIESLLDGGVINSPRLQTAVLEDTDANVDLSLASLQAWPLPQSNHFPGTTPSAASPPPLPASLQQLMSPTVVGVLDPTYSLETPVSRHQTHGESSPSGWSPLPSDWHDLTQVYLTVEHSWLPIVERHVLFRMAYTYQDHCDSRKSLDDRRRGEFSSLWAVLALGEVHSYGISSSRVVQFRSISQHFLSMDPMHEDYLDYAQALLLEATLHLGRNNLVLAKSALAQAFVLSSAVEGEGSSAKVLYRRQLDLTLFGCFVIDTLLSFTMGSRPQMTLDDLPSGSPCDESGSDEWEPFVNKFGTVPSSGPSSASALAAPSRVSSTFNHLVKLLCIMNAAMREQTSENALTASIEAWCINVPAHLKIAESSSGYTTKTFLPPQLHLKALRIAASFLGASRSIRPQTHVLNNDTQQRVSKDIGSVVLHMSQTFGVKSLPASLSVLVPLLKAHPFRPDEPGQSNVCDTITEYKSLWGWNNALCFDDSGLPLMLVTRDLSDGVPPRESLNHLIPAADPNNTSGWQSGQNSTSNIFTHEQPDTTGIDAPAQAVLNDTNISQDDILLGNTPDQLRDYLALLQENESTNNDQNFMQSLGFFDNFDYTDF
ncbi:hypothetical protein D6D01_02082 [Aureobasidium pullulans]|uniref:Zn(2)-C6 fungal-type domain-containing protein n=1 Tax=Aureobasidium pullulans TaxID=5580 RepID=A0A4S9LVJ6_AURPU|nr:hypothetical protein D6D01_02082 [Aureobasidium pullulans]